MDFESNVLNMKAEDATPPKQLPVGTYLARISNYEFDKSSQKQTPLVRYYYVPIEPKDDVDQDEFEEVKAEVDSDLSRKALRNEFYLTPNAIFMLRNHMEQHLGMEISGRTFEELIPELVGREVLIQVAHETSQNTGRQYSRIADFANPEA